MDQHVMSAPTDEQQLLRDRIQTALSRRLLGSVFLSIASGRCHPGAMWPLLTVVSLFCDFLTPDDPWPA